MYKEKINWMLNPSCSKLRKNNLLLRLEKSTKNGADAVSSLNLQGSHDRVHDEDKISVLSGCHIKV